MVGRNGTLEVLLMLDDKFDSIGMKRRGIREGHMVGQYTSNLKAASNNGIVARGQIRKNTPKIYGAPRFAQRDAPWDPLESLVLGLFVVLVVVVVVTGRQWQQQQQQHQQVLSQYRLQTCTTA
ncbi:hypothetical protein M0804_001517 [Polistes exclamans]|nr:hypothetical protein M0804_001517 [Polistes exclamans]